MIKTCSECNSEELRIIYDHPSIYVCNNCGNCRKIPELAKFVEDYGEYEELAKAVAQSENGISIPDLHLHMFRQASDAVVISSDRQ